MMAVMSFMLLSPSQDLPQLSLARPPEAMREMVSRPFRMAQQTSVKQAPCQNRPSLNARMESPGFPLIRGKDCEEGDIAGQALRGWQAGGAQEVL